jgi:GNAT superfamily N-acetyltransferase
MKDIVYRPATVADVDNIKDVTDLMLSHTKLGTATKKKIHALVTSPNTLVQIAVHGSKLVGFTCGIVHESIFNDRRRVSDIGVFVLEEYRRSTIARDLIQCLETWAREQGAEEIWLGQTTGDNPELVAKYYNRLGYQTQGFNSVKEL